MSSEKKWFLLFCLWIAGGVIWKLQTPSAPPVEDSARKGPVSQIVNAKESLAPKRQETVLKQSVIVKPSDKVKMPKTEEEWIVSDILSDIAEILSFAENPARPVGSACSVGVEIASGNQQAVSTVDLAGHERVQIKNSFPNFLWAKENHVPTVRRLLESWRIAIPSQTIRPNHQLLERLSSIDKSTLLAENLRVSKALSAAPLEAELHEEAALILGVFALSETAGHFSDIRHTLSRMSTHLALANAITGKLQICGEVAEALQLALCNCEQDAIDAVSKIPASASSWANAVKLRCTGDWRVIAAPEAATFLEQSEYARALVRSLGIRAFLAFLEKAKMPPGRLWNRIVMQGKFSVQEGHVFVRESLPAEIVSLADDWKMWYNKELPRDGFGKALNFLPTRCVAVQSDGKQRLGVFNWGDLASFHQRHICHSVRNTERFLSHQWGVPDIAEEFAQTVHSQLSEMRFYPILLNDYARNSKTAALSAEKTVLIAIESPELLPAGLWASLSETINELGGSLKMPDPLVWFHPILPYKSAYDFTDRYYALKGLYREGDAFWDALIKIAPYDFDVIRTYHYKKTGGDFTSEDAGEGLGKIVAFNLDAMTQLAKVNKNNPTLYEGLALNACKYNPDLYLGLAAYFVERNQPEKAAENYWRAFELAQDRVRMANCSSWIVNYYFDHNKKSEALKIAQAAAEVYSFAGLETMGGLMERMGKLEEAEKYYLAINERYEDGSCLEAFYRKNQNVNPVYKTKLQALIDTVFPKGMKQVQLSDFSLPPTTGVRVASTNSRTKNAGLNLGDVFVALDGVRVETMDQYVMIRGRSKKTDLNLIVWGNNRYREVTASPPEKRFGNDLKDYRAP